MDNSGGGAGAYHFYHDYHPGVKAVAGKGPRVFDVDRHYCNISSNSKS